MISLSFSILVFALFGCSVIHVKDRSVKTKGEMFSARHTGGMKKRIVVLPFLNQSSYTSSTYVDDARELFLTELKKTDEVIIQDAGAVGLNNLEEFRNGNSYKSEEMAKG